MKFVLILIISLVSPGLVLCQTSQKTLEDFISTSDITSSLYPVEKVHLHMDKQFYAAGQTVWFKAYVVDGANQPSMLSKILYVDLINEKRQIRKSLKLPISAGLGWGDIYLPDTLSQGTYRIRAYTQWMRNFGEESFFDQSFKMVNSFKSAPVKENKMANAQSVSVQFFPEGGQLIEGVRSRIAFKALGSNGIGKEVSGYVLDNAGIRVAEFKTDHAGMGSFLLTPFEGQSYKATITSSEGDKIVSLPTAAKDGYVINVTSNAPDKIIVRVTARPEAPVDEQELTMVVKSLDGSVLQLAFKMSRQFADVTVSTADLRTGVAQLILFDKKAIPVAERLIFVKKNDGLTISLSSDKQEYKMREKVKLEIAPAVEDQSSAIASFSVAVTDMSRNVFKEDEENSIFSSLLVKSELKGFIENPNYYFTGDADALKLKWKHLDNLLMTQGWRRLDWLDTKPKLVFMPEKGMTISGTMLLAGTPVSGGKVTAFTPDGGTLIDTLSDSKGRFNFDNLVFADSTRFVIQGRTGREKANVQIKLDQVAPQSVLKDIFTADAEVNIASTMETYIKDVKEELAELLKQGLITRTNILDEVVVTAVKDSKKLENSSKLGNTPADYVFRSEQLSDQNLGFALKGKVLGFDFYVDPRTGVVTGSLAKNARVSGPPSMELVVDGMPLGTDLSQINMADVAYVEVLDGGPSAAIYGGRGAAGVIVVTTKGFAGISNTVQVEAQGIIKYSPKGYTVTRTFYSPDYYAPETKKDVSDFRSTIYWNPDIFSDKGVVKPIEFFTADKPGTYRVVVEGIDYRGKIGRTVQTFTVK